MKIENRIAIFCTESNWVGPHGVARELFKAGIHVICLAPEDAYLAQSKYISERQTFSPDYGDPASFVAELKRMIAEHHPYLVIPGDGGAVEVIHALRDDRRASPLAQKVVNRSVASKKVTDRYHLGNDFIANFNDFPCRFPPTLLNPTLDETCAFAEQHGYPVVFKREGLSSGQGVTLCRNLFEVRQTHERHVFERFAVQKFIAGIAASAAIAGLDGRVSGCLANLKQELCYENGPSSVRKYLDHPDMIATARGIFERARFSGLCGIDFIVDADGRGWLLEFNQRITPHSADGWIFGNDIVSKFVHDLRREPHAPDPPKINDYIAIFPNEVRRDPESPYLRHAYHDVPWDDPDVLKAIVNRVFR